MFERYTEAARRVLFFSRHEATRFGSFAIEPQHVLLGLLREGRGIASQIVEQSQGSPSTIREAIERRITSREKAAVSVEIPTPFSAETRQVLLYAATEADRLAHADIDTEHLLLGILVEERSIAAVILIEKGLDLAKTRDQVVRFRKQKGDRNNTTRMDVSQQTTLLEGTENLSLDPQSNGALGNQVWISGTPASDVGQFVGTWKAEPRFPLSAHTITWESEGDGLRGRWVVEAADSPTARAAVKGGMPTRIELQIGEPWMEDGVLFFRVNGGVFPAEFRLVGDSDAIVGPAINKLPAEVAGLEHRRSIDGHRVRLTRQSATAG